MTGKYQDFLFVSGCVVLIPLAFTCSLDICNEHGADRYFCFWVLFFLSFCGKEKLLRNLKQKRVCLVLQRRKGILQCRV